MAELKLVVFDVDGTLIDSLAHISAAMLSAFDASGLTPPPGDEIKSIIGLSLPVAMARLAPTVDARVIDGLVENYKSAFASKDGGSATSEAPPLFAGVRALLDELAARDDVLLGVATGKSRRGLDRMFDLHDLHSHFMTTQVADDHPSKPNPSMLEQTMRDTGVDARDAIMIGDTTFDLQMGRSAGFATIGVSWGYHPTAALLPHADALVDDMLALRGALTQIWDDKR